MAGRREVPVDPGAGPVKRFAFELRKLRAEAGGITYRVLADRAGYGVTTLSQAAAGDQLPTLPVVLAYVTACGGDPEEWEARWKRAVDEVATLGSPDDGGAAEPPYKGLARFETGDSARFFGRDRLTADLLDLLRRQRVAAMFGPSGSGKSSLLRAGLIPALQHLQEPSLRPAAIRILTPGHDPARTHARVLNPAGTSPGGPAGPGVDTFVIVDQFEEIFTLCHDPAERDRFLDLMMTAHRPANRLRVLIAVRADFYGHCAEHRRLADALRDASLLIGPMHPAELRAAIVKPAAAEGLTVERALTSRLVEEVADAPGGLPLLSHVLMETWRRRRGKTMTLASYEAAGGLGGAVAKTAEDVYRRFTQDQASAARRLLLRLVTPGDGTPDTRRPTQHTELRDVAGEETAEVLEALTRARLLTLDDDTVDLAHETLLTAWPRLRGWIQQDREQLRLQRKLTEAAQAWEEVGHDPGALFRGTRLTAVEERFGAHRMDLTELEYDFLTTSISARKQEEDAAARTSRRLHRLRAGLSVLAVLVLLAVVIAWRQSESEDQERMRNEARRVAALAESLRATDPVTAMRLSIAAWNLVDLPETRSALMSAAVQKEQDAFTDPDTDPEAVRYLSGDGRTLISVAARQVSAWDVRTHTRSASFPGLGADLAHAGVLSPDVRALTLLGEEGAVQVWDVRAGRPVGGSLPADDGGEISPSGRVLVLYRTAGPRAVVQLRDIKTRRVLLERRMDDRLPEIGPNKLVDVSDFVQQRLFKQRLMRSYPLPDVQISPDDRLMALCLPGARLEVWNIARGQKLPTSWAPVTTAKNCAEEDFQFTPDSRHLVLRGPAGLRTWDMVSGRELPRIRHDGLKGLAFSPDGRFLAATDADEILLWRTDASAAPVFRYFLSDEVVSELRLDMAERRIRYFAGRSQTVVRSLALDTVVDSPWLHRPGVSASFSPDARTLAFARQDGRTGKASIQLRETRSGRSLANLPSALCTSQVDGPPTSVPCPVHMAFRHDGGALAYGVSHPATSVAPEKVYLWDVTARRTTGTVTVTRKDPTTSGAQEPAVNGITFHPDGKTLLVSRIPTGEFIEYWNIHRGKKTREVSAVGGEALLVRPGGDILATNHGQFMDLSTSRVTRRALTTGITTALAYSPDGSYLAAGDESGGVSLWDGAAGPPLAVLPSPPARDDLSRYVSALAFSPDGRTLAAAGADGTLRLWDVSSSRQIGSALPTAGTAILAVAFDSDSKTLYTSSAHVPLQPYNISTGHTVAQACKRAGTGLTAHQWRTYIHGAPYRRTC
ncbi:nSTAND1 domain-containing NTPase [Streptomyces echinatus]|uniref:nSTAND1 domain-containing NTPase n=1 Tax=Streptomyces echinatus TaxID=67293 RepID=UPI003802BF9B